MSTRASANPIEVQAYLFKLFDDKVSFNTYSTNPPKTLLPSDTDFVVIGIPKSGRDYDAYGELSVIVEIFVKADDRGLQNNVRLRDLQNEFTKVLNVENERSGSPYVILKTQDLPFVNYDEVKGYHVLINFFKIIIK